MFYKSQQSEMKKQYKEMLSIIGSLTLLFSENDTPYLPYRCHENIFCKYFDAENLSRSDCSVDAIKKEMGIGLKTWIGLNDQKIAEFGKLKSTYRNLTGLDLVKKISEYRNERIRITKNIYGIKEMIYHIVKRIPGKMQILEHAFDYIDIQNITLLEGRGNDNNTYFTDGKHTYHFSTSKNTLYMIFDDMELLDEFDIDIISDPYEYLLALHNQIDKIEVKSTGCSQANRKNKLCLRLYSVNSDGTKFVPERSGLNQWNANGRTRDENEIYIPYQAEDRNRDLNFFPPRDTTFKLHLPNGSEISAKVCQGVYPKLSEAEMNLLSPEERQIEIQRQLVGKAIMSNPNKELGKWLLREVFELPTGTLVTYEMLEIFGIDSVIFTKNNDLDYSIDFSELGTYEEFYYEN